MKNSKYINNFKKYSSIFLKKRKNGFLAKKNMEYILF